MLRFYADSFMRAYDHIVALRMIATDPKLKPIDTLLPPADLRERLVGLAVQLEDIGAEFTLLTVRKFINELDGKPLKVSHLKSRVEDINLRINDELSRAKFFLVETHPEYLDPAAPLFGEDVANKFASAAFDIEEAGRCLALGLTTASVFHLMRVLEIGLKASSSCLKIPSSFNGADRNWGAMLRKMKDEVERRNKATPPAWQRVDDKNFIEEIYASLDAVRNVWRNSTMHVEKKYKPDEAEHILVAVKGFMRKLASRIDEDGKPHV